jgi:allantoin racemase
MRLLLINPNSSAHITARLAASAREMLDPGDALTAISASGAPAVVRWTEWLRQADANALALADAHAPGHDAVLLAISLDGAATLLRVQHRPRPVVGMTEAALMTACLHVDRIGLLTLGAALLPLYRERVDAMGLTGRVTAWQAPQAPAAFDSSCVGVEPGVLDMLVDACARLREDGAEAVVLAGAVLCGYASALTARTGVPVFDGMHCAVAQARLLVRLARG